MKVTLELKNVDGQMQLESVQSIRLFDSDDDDIK